MSQIVARAIVLGIAILFVFGETLSAENLGDHSFSRAIEPILARKCYSCHGSDNPETDLRLNAFECSSSHDLPAGDSVGLDEKLRSELKRRIQSDQSDQMPPLESGKSLTDQERSQLIVWIDAGAKIEKHWADRPVRRPIPPVLKNNVQAASPIDAFVQHRLESEQLSPQRSADRAILVRRLYLDLIGLPPTPKQAAEFIESESDGAYSDLVNQLLASPEFGERWAVWWLDLARYADSNGFEKDRLRSMWPYRDWVIKALNDNMPFDQFTIEQLAGDLLPEPTVSQQIATGFHRNTVIHDEVGVHADQFRDVVLKNRVDTTAEVWLGASMHCAQCHDHKHDPISQKDYYAMYAFFANTTDPTVSGFDDLRFDQSLFDSQEVASPLIDYDFAEGLKSFGSARYELQQTEEAQANIKQQLAFWEGGRYFLAVVVGAACGLGGVASLLYWRPGTLRAYLPQRVVSAVLGLGVLLFVGYLVRVTSLELQAAQTESAIAKQKLELVPIEQEYLAAKRWIGQTLVMREGEPTKVCIQHRGDFQSLGEQVQCDVPSFLGLPLEGPANRLGLAQWLVDPQNPRTSRVLVNRIWGKMIGRPIVSSTADFGLGGEPPTHPQLLDWLAAEFIESGWDFKHLLRTIVLSDTYRQSSAASDDDYRRDPDNYYLARGSRFRLDAEVLRDSALAAAGLLTKKLGGPCVYPPQPDSVWDRAYDDAGRYTPVWQTEQGSDRYRRSIYMVLRRSVPHPVLTNFDTTGRYNCTSWRPVTCTPSQALTLMNERGYVEAAGGLAKLCQQVSGSDIERIRYAFRRCATRSPSERELAVLSELLDEMKANYRKEPAAARDLLQSSRLATNDDPCELAAWVMVADTILNLDYVITRE